MILRRLCLGLFLTATLISAQRSDLLEKVEEQVDIRREARSFDIDRDFFFDAVNRYVPSIVRSGLSETTGAVTTVIRFATMLNLARFDANSPYTATSVGITTQIPRRPHPEWTLRNKNLACIYAGYRVLLGVIPRETERIRQMMVDLGLDPDDNREDYQTAVGIGNLCGNNVVKDRLDDGVNQLGNRPGITYNRNPYSDYTSYKSVNTAQELVDPSRWQPAIETDGKGKFTSQIFVTPHNGLTRPYLIKDVNQYEVGPHGRILKTQYDLQTYRETTDEVIRESAKLNDERKLKSEFFEDKARSILGSIFFTIKRRQFGIDEFCQLELMSNMAIFDTMIVVWKEKRRWDAVRPFSAIKYLYGDQKLTAWGGPFRGIVNDIPASQWTSYLPVADHPEYPSATTGACVAHAETMRTFLGDDDLSWDVTFEAGESRIEPGALPAYNQTYRLQTFSDFAYQCGESRMWAGVHFQDAIDVIKPIATEIGQLAARFVIAQFNAEPAQPYHHPNAVPTGPVVPAPGPAAPLQIQELPRKSAYPAHHQTYAHHPITSGFPGYGYPVTPAPAYHTPPPPAPVSPAGPAVIPPVRGGIRNPKDAFSNHFSFSLGK